MRLQQEFRAISHSHATAKAPNSLKQPPWLRFMSQETAQLPAVLFLPAAGRRRKEKAKQHLPSDAKGCFSQRCST